jgi:uncharacterized protein GlcG (DUF336 family)
MPFARTTARLAIAAPLLALAAMPASAQGLVSEKALSLDMAEAMAHAALEKCRADGNQVSIAVVDRDGLPKAVLRDDHSGPHTLDTSRRKAFTSVTFKRSSADFAKLVSEPGVAGLKDTAGTIALGGGLPVKVGNEVIGAIGVSGSPGADKDEACARAGIEKVADQLK